MSINQFYSDILRANRSMINKESLTEILKHPHRVNDTKTKKEFPMFLDSLNIPHSENPTGVLASYFGLRSGDSNIICNDTQFSSILNALMHIRQHDEEILIFTNTGWNTVELAELNNIINAVSTVVLGNTPPSSSKIKNIIDYLKVNANDTKGLMTTEFIQLANGVFDVNTGEFLDHSPERIPKIRLEVCLKDFNTREKEILTPKFNRYINDITANNVQYKDYLLDVYASLLDLSAPTSIYGVVLYGSGGNGKSVLLRLMESFFRETNVTFKALDDFGKDFGLEGMRSAMINISHELSSSSPKQESIRQLKRMLDDDGSGKLINVNEKFKAVSKVSLDLKMIFASNSIIDFGADHRKPLSRRITILPFYFTPLKEDFNLSQDLKEEKEEIVSALLTRIHKIHKRGSLSPTPKIVETSNAIWFSNKNYFRDNPKLAKEIINWLDQHIEFSEGSKINRAELNNKIKNDISEATSSICNSIIKQELSYDYKKVNGIYHWENMSYKTKSSLKNNPNLIKTQSFYDQFY